MDVDEECASNRVDHGEVDIDDVVRSIFSSCDVDNTNLVAVSNLIEFIKPFLMEDLNALESLRLSLDPEGTNTLVNSETFYEVMSHWSQKLGNALSKADSSADTEFDKSPRATVMEDQTHEDLPSYVHSTPRTSLGDKLLKCKDLLNLSNISSYSLSTSRMEQPESEKTILEEQLKKFEHDLLKANKELLLTKQQLTVSEEQNEQLQQDLERINKRLHAEQQVNEHLQRDKQYIEDLRDDLSNNYKRDIEESRKKLIQSEKDSLYRKNLISEMENEKARLEKRIETLCRQHQDCLKELFDMRTETQAKEDQFAGLTKVYNEMKQKFCEQKDLIDQLREENDLLTHQKVTLEKILKSKSSSYPDLGNMLNDLFKTPSPQHSPNISSSPFLSSPQSPYGVQPKYRSTSLLKRVLSRHSTPTCTGGSVTDPTQSDVIKRCPSLSPVKDSDLAERQGSSDEDLSWKLQPGNDQDSDGQAESLCAEIHRADSIKIGDSTYYSVGNEDQIAELEFEIEELKIQVEDIKEQNNELVGQLEKLMRTNGELIEENKLLKTKEESASSEVEELKQRVVQLEQNCIEEKHDLEKVGDVEAASLIKTDNVASLENEICELQERFNKMASLKDDYDEKLRNVMRDLGEVAAQKLSLQEKISTLEEEKVEAEKRFAEAGERLENALGEVKALREELTLVESQITHKNDLNGTRDEEVTQYLEEKSKLLQNEIKEFKESLEKKLVSEFERKVKYSLDAEEKILHLTQKFNSQEEEMNSLEENLNYKNRIIADTENRLTLLTSKNATLQNEINSLNASKTELEIQVAEYDRTITQMEKVDSVAEEIQMHIRSKNGVIDELKQLNRQLEASLNEARLDLGKKIDDILELRDELTNGLAIKNELWKKVKSMNKDLNHKTCEINGLEANYQALIDSNKELSIEYNNLLIIHDLEVIKSNKERTQYLNKHDELQAELDASLAKIAEETKENQHLKKLISELENTTEFLEAEIRRRTDQKLNVDKRDFTSQTVLDDMLEIEEALSKAEKESEQLLNELEAKLNEEVNKNKSVTVDLLELNRNFTKNNDELNDIKRKLTESEAEMSKKLQDNYEKCNNLIKEISEAKECINDNHIEMNKIQMQLKEAEEALERAEERNLQMAKRSIEDKQNYDVLAEELTKTKEDVIQKDTEMSKVQKELAETKEILDTELDRNTRLIRHLDEKNEAYTILFEDLSRAEDIISKNNIELRKLTDELNQSRTLLSEERDSVHDLELKLNASREFFDEHIQELREELTLLHNKLDDKRAEIEALKDDNKLVKDALDLIQRDNNQLILELKEEINKAEKEKHNLKRELTDASMEVDRLKERMSAEEMKNTEQIKKLKDDFVKVTKQEKDTLNQELARLKQNLSSIEKDKNTTHARLQEEMSKNKALFENFSTVKQERDKFSFDLKEIEVLFSASQISFNEKQAELQKLQNERASLESLFNRQTTEFVQLEAQLAQCRADVQLITRQRDELISQLSKIKTSSVESKSTDKERGGSPGSADKGRTYSRQQITIDRLKDKVEHLEDQLKAKDRLEGQLKSEKDKCQQLENSLSLMQEKLRGNAELEKLLKEIAQKEVACEALQGRHEAISCEIVMLEQQLTLAKCELEDVDSELERKKLERDDFVALKETNEIGIQVHDNEESNAKSECKPVNKFTLASRSESPDSPSLDIESIGLASVKNLCCFTKSSFNFPGDSILEVPSLDVNGFADDIVDELDLSDTSPRKKLDRDELESKVTALSLRLVANSNNISERIDTQTEKYRCQYEAILTLLTDISHRLRDHVCIGTAEPIVPVYVLLEEIKMQLRGLVQNAGQVGVLICEEKMKRCWNLVVNYVAVLRQDNEELHNISRETTPTQTGLTRRKTKSTQDKSDEVDETHPRRSRLGRCSKLSSCLVIVVAFAIAVSLVVNLTCRMSASENQYCPLDGIARRVNIGLPPM